MSGDVQPRKRKEKRKKKEEEELLPQHVTNASSDEIIHIHKETKLGGNFCSKIVFFCLLGALGIMVGLIILEYHGTSEKDVQSAVGSPWSVMFEGWVDDNVDHKDHDDDAEHYLHEDEDNHVERELGNEGHVVEEEEDDIEDISFVQQTYDDLKAVYNQITPDESDADHTDEDYIKSTDYEATESEPEVTEDESLAEEEEGEDILNRTQSNSPHKMRTEEVESETEEESEDEATSSSPMSRGPQSLDHEEERYVNADITNEADWEIRQLLDEADRELDEGNPTTALSKFSHLTSTHPLSPRALAGRARTLDRLAEVERSNTLLTEAIAAFSAALQAPNLPAVLLLRLANRTIDRMRFKGMHLNAVKVHEQLIQVNPKNISFRIDLAITYLMINRLADARAVLEACHSVWPEDVLCQGYLGLTLKLQGLNELAIPHLLYSVQSDHQDTVNSRFYFHLGDALQRNKQNDLAISIYQKGVVNGLFRSKYQRSLYNVDRLKAKPWWTLDETTYGNFFRKLENNWKVIKNEGLAAYKDRQSFLDEAESLRDIGDWKQFELYARGQKMMQNCKKAPVTCQLIEESSAARTCRRGQVKFSVMEGGTHVWPHCGPTNCRLRAHLGLVVPPGPVIRVANETRTWQEGEVMVFDDSFEHEVWHNGNQGRLVLIVDVWHPELTAAERNSLGAI